MIKKIITDFITSIRNKKLNVFFLFLLSSFIILIVTKLSKEYTNTIAFNIEKINIPKDKVILNDSNTVLKITLKTHGFMWIKYYFSEPKITIDFSNEIYNKNSKYFYAKSVSYLNEKKQFSNSKVKLLNINPDTLVFNYDTNLVKKIPVIIDMDISFTPGYNVLEAYKTIPDSIEIIGSNALVKNITSFQTEKVELKNVKSNINQKVKIALPKNLTDLKFSNTEVELIATVEKFTEGKIKIPVKVINLPSNISVTFFPKEVTVSYYTSLVAYNSIKSKDFEIICDYSKINENQSFLIPEITKAPKKVKNVKISQQRIEFIILK